MRVHPWLLSTFSLVSPRMTPFTVLYVKESDNQRDLEAPENMKERINAVLEYLGSFIKGDLRVTRCKRDVPISLSKIGVHFSTKKKDFLSLKIK